jgi:hypothetical protein
LTQGGATTVTDIFPVQCWNQFDGILPNLLLRREGAMQLHLEADELNLLANILMKNTDAAHDALLNMVLARNLRFDSEELEQLADLVAAEKRDLTDQIALEPDRLRKGALQTTLALLERVLEHVDEACVMI